MLRLETTILKNLIYNEAYMRKVIPFLKSEYFKEQTERLLFKHISLFIEKYKNPPTFEALVIEITESTTSKEDQIKDAVDLLKDIQADKDQPTDIPWLLVHTEKFCKDSALYGAVLEAVSIMDDGGKEKDKKPKESIPGLLQSALAVSFDPSVGHDYMLDSDSRFEAYHTKVKKIPFDLEFFNKITKGGFSIKTLNVFLAGTGVGKTLVMCHIAAAALAAGYNVLYITLEMAEEKIAERIDANLLNVPLDDLENISKADYDRRFSTLKQKTHGKLIIKEYPTAGASVHHFRGLINEIALKKSFSPDIILVDYINICMSSRIKMGGSTNSYGYVKAIAEELRGLAVENLVPLVTATQTTRGGFESTDLELTDTSESFGLPATADFFAAIISTEELDKMNQFMIKQLKSRYNDKGANKRFVIGVDKPKMRLYDVSQTAQQGIQDAGQPQQQEVQRKPFEKKQSKDVFSQFKI